MVRRINTAEIQSKIVSEMMRVNQDGFVEYVNIPPITLPPKMWRGEPGRSLTFKLGGKWAAADSE